MSAQQEIEALKQEHQALEDQINDAHARQRQIRELVDALMLAQKPTYPLDIHLEGLDEALRRIDAGTKPKSHHGDPCGPESAPYSLVADPTSRWMHLRDMAPYRLKGGEKVWRFTDEEIDMYLSLIESKGYPVIKYWRSDGGVSIIVGLKS